MTKKDILISMLSFVAVSLIFIFVPSLRNRTIRRLPLLAVINETRGYCGPNGSTDEFLVGADGWVRCAVQPDGVPIFIAKTQGEAWGKRLGYLNYLAEHQQYFSDEFGSVEKAKQKIKFCGDTLYFSLDGSCHRGELLPYPGMFPYWVPRDSRLAEKIQAGYERRFGKNNI